MTFDRFHGWDIGGAHLKVAELGADGRLLGVRQYATPLWTGLKVLSDLLATLAVEAGDRRILHAITMTGELVDFFPDRRAGVERLLKLFCETWPSGDTRVYSIGDGLLPVAAARSACEQIASANWHATATVAGERGDCGILLDIGSTTTDVVPFRDGRACAHGGTDQERLQSNELVYTGVTRTPVMALAQRVPYTGRWQNLAAEFFATMADVHRITGELDDSLDLQDSADGGGKTRTDSLRRLSRMIGMDFDPKLPVEPLQQLASYLAHLQLQQVRSAVQSVCRQSGMTNTGVIVGAGSGFFLARRVAQDLGFRFSSFSEWCEVGNGVRTMADVCASAIAVARLGWQQVTR